MKKDKLATITIDLDKKDIYFLHKEAKKRDITIEEVLIKIIEERLAKEEHE